MESNTCNAPFLLYPSLGLLLIIILSFQEIFYFPTTTVLSNSNQLLFTVKKLQQNIVNIEEGLARARAAVLTAAQTQTYISPKNESFIPRGIIYRNPYAFHQSYIEMEKRFKIWVYKEGEPPLFHYAPMKDIYSIEGHFIAELEDEKNPFVTHHPKDALAFFLPVSISKIVQHLYQRGYYRREQMQNVVTDYIGVVSKKYEYWNRSSGADHFYVGCHDWAPDVSQANPKLFANMIRVLCNANKSEGFQPARDVSLVETNVPYKALGPPLDLGQPPNKRPILAFFSGGAHGYVREKLFQYWKKKDKDIQVYEYLPKAKNENYFKIMGRTKFCLCPSGYEVASPRVVESIYSGCVPVIISDGYVLPFSDVLDWSQFSVYIPVAKIPEMKKILQAIPMDEYLRKHKLLMEVQRHFILHRPSQPYDLLHMILHSVWLRRLDMRIQSSYLSSNEN